MTNSRRLDLDQDLAGPGTFQIEFDDLKRLLGLERDCGACLHLPFLHSSFLEPGYGFLKVLDHLEG